MYMKLQYDVNRTEGNFDIDLWFKKNEPIHGPSRIQELDNWYLEYKKVKVEFSTFLQSFEDIIDENDIKLTPLQIYNAIDYYKIRIQKLWLIIQPRLMITHNENKATGVKYVVVRAMWIDQNGQFIRRFSKNLGAEDKVKVNGRITDWDSKEVKKTITFYMQDLYSLEYSVTIKSYFTPEINYPPS